MNYRSVRDISDTIRTNLYKIPESIDLIVGIPRSGLFAASLIGLQKNLNFVSLEVFLFNGEIRSGSTRFSRNAHIKFPLDAKHILLVDDSTSSGASMKSALDEIRGTEYTGQISTCAIYTTKEAPAVDIWFEVLPHTRIFEWNLMHREFLSQCCVDLDGVLCWDPTEEENDDGNKYLEFIATAKPLLIPSYPIGRIVTSRLEKYRKPTIEWLNKYQINFSQLDMLDLPDAETRRRLNIHAKFKSHIYSNDSAMRLFIESEKNQAVEIARRSGKFALSFSTQELFAPGITLPYAQQATQRWLKKGKNFLYQLMNRK